MKQDLRILLVEQDISQAHLISEKLTEKFPSSSISVLNNGHTALEELRRNTFDIAIIELDLPDVDGLGFVELIRKENHNLLIIVTGDYRSEQAIVEAVKAGADEYLTRNASFHLVLPEAINRLCARHELGADERRYVKNLKQQEQANLIRITAGTMYHEINNPLMTILGMTELILDNGYDCDHEVTKKLRIIRKSAQRIQITLTRMSLISEPTIKETASGKMIDPRMSRVAVKSEDKGSISTE